MMASVTFFSVKWFQLFQHMGGVAARCFDCAAENMGVNKNMQATPAIIAVRNTCMDAPPEVCFKMHLPEINGTAELASTNSRRERLMRKDGLSGTVVLDGSLRRGICGFSCQI